MRSTTGGMILLVVLVAAASHVVTIVASHDEDPQIWAMEPVRDDVIGLNALPPDLILRICELAGSRSLFVISSVCKYYRHVIQTEPPIISLMVQWRKSIRAPYPVRKEIMAHNRSLKGDPILVGSFSIYGEPLYSLKYCYVIHQRSLRILDDHLQVIRCTELHGRILNSPSERDRLPAWICWTDGRTVSFLNPIQGNMIWAFQCSTAKCYSGNYLLVAESDHVALMYLDFAAQQLHCVWRQPIVTHHNLEFHLRGDNIVLVDTSGWRHGTTRLIALDARSGHTRWTKDISAMNPTVLLSETLLTISYITKNGNLQIEHFEADDGDHFKKNSRNEDIFGRICGHGAVPVLVQDDLMIVRMPLGDSRTVLFVFDFLLGCKYEQVQDDRDGRFSIGIAMRESRLGPVILSLTDLDI